MIKINQWSYSLLQIKVLTLKSILINYESIKQSCVNKKLYCYVYWKIINKENVWSANKHDYKPDRLFEINPNNLFVTRCSH